jgi:hypothetical protein
MDIFENADVDRLIVGHYSPEANQRVAATIEDYLNRSGGR